VYALAATMYRAVTGIVPPDALDRNERDEIVPPRSLAAEVSPAAEAVLLRGLAVDPAARFQGMEEFQHALVAAASGKMPSLDIAIESDRDSAGKSRRGPDAVPLPGVEAVEKVAAVVLPIAERLNGFSAIFGFRPASFEEAASPGGATLAAGTVGAFGALAGAIGLAANLLLLLAAYLTSRNDARGPVIGWAAASTLVVVAVVSYLLFLMNFSGVAGWALAWRMTRPQFGSLVVALMLLGIVFVLFARRRRA
jgi:hypothetical protein